MPSALRPKAKLHTRYPLSSVLIYNGSTVAHYLLGGAGIIIGFSFSPWAGYLFGALYLGCSFVEMYIIMPLTVCPNCVYFKIKDSLCISGLSVFSKKIAKEGDPKKFAGRAEGIIVRTNYRMAFIEIISLMYSHV